MTYPEASVAALIAQHAVPLQFNNQEAASRPVLDRYRHVWTPDIRILSVGGEDLYHWNGYLAPFEFAPQFLVAVAQAKLRLHDYDGAAQLFEETVTKYPTSVVAPEAQYFLAVARYRKSGDGGDLLKGWHRLATRYPTSVWTVKQDFH